MALVTGARNHSVTFCLFSIPFLIVGLGFTAALVLGGPGIFKDNKVKSAHPDEPWLWESDWASGVISSHATRGSVGSWIIAVLWNCVAIPAAVGVMSQYHHHPDNKSLIVLLFLLLD